ncbi:hypothetical protein ACHAWF_010911 [Thalassiosira exigua]
MATALLTLTPSSTEGFVTFQNPSPGSTRRPLTSVHNDPHGGETPEERKERMDNVRRIQSSFYKNSEADEGGGGGISPDGSEGRWLARDPANPAILDNLPLWRVQWTELPGYQNVLNVHVPHYTHMFRRLTLQHPRPWLFGSVYLPGGSENVGNPDYFLPEQDGMSDDELRSIGRGSNVTLTGTLMQITHCVSREDGRLTVIVQGVGRFRILAARQQVPYAIARVEMVPDTEAWEQYLLPVVANTATDVELSKALMKVTKDMAAREDELFRDLEYLEPVFNEGTGIHGQGVSALSNFNGTAQMDPARIREEAEKGFSDGLAREAERFGSDEILIASQSLKLDSDFALDVEDVEFLESQVWIEVDRMIKLLQRAKPGMKVPIPSQIMGLLPADTDWPPDFQLEKYAETLETDQVDIGTHTKSPFVRVAKRFRDYPKIRRASRLSYVVWILLSSILRSSPSQELLEETSIANRLQMAIDALKKVNGALDLGLGR